jgi:glutathione S-transferase
MITLYGSLQSRANRCDWMLKEMGIDYTHVPTAFWDGSTRKPDYLAINPNGRVPALVDNGFTLFESLAINLYLAEKYGGPLAPDTAQGRALALQWSLWVETEVEKPLLLVAANLALFGPEGHRPAEVDIGLRKLARPFGVLEKHLATQPYLLGDAFSVADLNIASVMTLVPVAGIDLQPWPRLAVWLTLCLERPAASAWKTVNFRIPRPATDLGILEMFV